VAFAQDESVLAQASGVGDINVDKAAIVQGNQRNCRRKCSACVKTLVDGVAALLQGQQPDVGVFDGQKLQQSLAEGVISGAADRFGSSATFLLLVPINGGRCRHSDS
jgi:hypothetical protein